MELGFGLIVLHFKARIQNNNEFKVLNIDITTSPMEERVTSVIDFSLALQVLAKLEVSLAPRFFKKSVDFISVPIPGARIEKAVKLEQVDNSISVPLKFGFFEVPIVAAVEISLECELTNAASLSFNSGRNDVTIFVKGPYNDLDYGGTPVYNQPNSTSFQWPRLVGFSNRAGVREKVSFYASFLEARISTDVGCEFEVICHLIQQELNAVLQNFGLFVTNNLKFEGWVAKYLLRTVVGIFVPKNIFSLTLRRPLVKEVDGANFSEGAVLEPDPLRTRQGVNSGAVRMAAVKAKEVSESILERVVEEILDPVRTVATSAVAVRGPRHTAWNIRIVLKAWSP